MSRKNLLYIKIALLVVLLIFVILMATAMFTNWAFLHGGTFFGATVIDGEGSGVASVEQEYDGIKEIEIYVYSIDVIVNKTQTDKVKLIDNTNENGVLTAGTNKQNTVRVSGDKLYFEQWSNAWGNTQNVFNTQGGGLNIITTNGFGCAVNSSDIGGEIILEVPSDTKIEYIINSVSGNVELDAIYDSELELNTVSGNVKVINGGEDIDVDTVSGKVEIYDPFENIKLNAVSADMYVVADENTQKVSSNSVSGDLNVKLQGNVNCDVNIDSLSGDIVNQYEQNSGDDVETVRIDGNSVSGDIEIHDWQ